MDLSYLSKIERRVDETIYQAKETGIDLAQVYPKNSLGYKLQEELDSVGRDLNLGFSGETWDEEIYARIDNCLDKIIHVSDNRLFTVTLLRKNMLKKRHEKGIELKEAIDYLSGLQP